MAMSLFKASALIPGTGGAADSPLLSSCLTGLPGACFASDTTGEADDDAGSS